MAPTTDPAQDPCLVGLLEILTVSFDRLWFVASSRSKPFDSVLELLGQG